MHGEVKASLYGMELHSTRTLAQAQNALSLDMNPTEHLWDEIQRRLNPLTDDKTLDWSKLKQIADNILKCI